MSKEREIGFNEYCKIAGITEEREAFHGYIVAEGNASAMMTEQLWDCGYMLFWCEQAALITATSNLEEIVSRLPDWVDAERFEMELARATETRIATGTYRVYACWHGAYVGKRKVLHYAGLVLVPTDNVMYVPACAVKVGEVTL